MQLYVKAILAVKTLWKMSPPLKISFGTKNRINQENLLQRMKTQTLIALNLFTSLFANCFKTFLAANPKVHSPWRIGFSNPIWRGNILAFLILEPWMQLLLISTLFSCYFPPFVLLILFLFWLIYLNKKCLLLFIISSTFGQRANKWHLHCLCSVRLRSRISPFLVRWKNEK